ncbi:MAG TPA: PilZ domain-containing protein [Kofleriaceae bacterium]|nr:PilZ domain-containing protein [Kofleriaceae bacterium]
MLDLVYEYRVLLGKCSSGAGLTMDEIERLTNLEAAFEAGEDDRRAHDGRKFRRERVSLPAVVRGGDLHDAVTVAELTLGGMVLHGAPYAETGAIIDLAIDDASAHRSYRFKGRVQWVGDDTNDDYRLGIELTGAPILIRYSGPTAIDLVLASLAA